MIDYFISTSTSSLNISDAYSFVLNEKAGGIDMFIGTIRNHNEGKKVLKLEYHLYQEMVIHEFELIYHEAKNKWPLIKCYIQHRYGALEIGDIAVIVAVSTVHRSECFEATRFIIDELKHRAPIWKKEYTDKGIFWVEGCEHRHTHSEKK